MRERHGVVMHHKTRTKGLIISRLYHGAALCAGQARLRLNDTDIMFAHDKWII